MTGPKVTGMYHMGITVSDLEKSIQFYCDYLGFKLDSKREVTDDYIFKIVNVPGTTAINIAFLSLPGENVTIELLEYVGSERHSGSSRPSDYGTGHICVYVEDLETLHRELSSKGVKFRSDAPVEVTSGPNEGGKIIYSLDPDNYIVELVQPKK